MPQTFTEFSVCIMQPLHFVVMENTSQNEKWAIYLLKSCRSHPKVLVAPCWLSGFKQFHHTLENFQSSEHCSDNNGL